MIEQRYIEILFNTAVKTDCVDDINEQFEIFMSILHENPTWLTLLSTPTVRHKEKEKLIKDLKVFNNLFIHFLMSLIRNRHIIEIEKMYEDWLIKARLKQKIAFVQLYISSKPTKAQLERLKEEIEPLFTDLTVEFNVHIDKSLIRGVRLTYQGRNIERSVKKDLENMRTHI